MIELPIPFVVALLLTILTARLATMPMARRSNNVVMVFTGACAVLSVIVGLRWSFDIAFLRFLQPVVAAVVPPVAWWCFARLVNGHHFAVRHLVGHALPVAGVIVLSATWPLWHPPIDFVIAALFAAYGLALLRLSRTSPDDLKAARLSDVETVRRMAAIAGLVLMASGLVDLLIGLDFDMFRGRHAALIVTYANMISLLFVAYGVVMISPRGPVLDMETRSSDSSDKTAGNQTTGRTSPDLLRQPALGEPDYDGIVAAIEDLMASTHLYRDPDLTLDRLARRAVIPARQISAAINRVCGCNVSQRVNEYRIVEAQTLLTDGDMPVTDVMFACGFQTKSNFNREFRRITGTSPRDFRRLSHEPASPIAPSADHF